MKSFIKKNPKLAGAIGLIVSWMIAIIYVFILPEEISYANGIAEFTLRYAHSLCWFLLGVASAFHALGVGKGAINALTYSALGVYISFIATLTLIKFS